MIDPRIGDTHPEPGNFGAVYPNQPWIVSLKNSTGTVNASDSQNRSRNMATL